MGMRLTFCKFVFEMEWGLMQDLLIAVECI